VGLAAVAGRRSSYFSRLPTGTMAASQQGKGIGWCRAVAGLGQGSLHRMERQALLVGSQRHGDAPPVHQWLPAVLLALLDPALLLLLAVHQDLAPDDEPGALAVLAGHRAIGQAQLATDQRSDHQIVAPVGGMIQLERVADLVVGIVEAVLRCAEKAGRAGSIG